MTQTEVLIRIILTIVFGAILGLESETREIEQKGEKKAQLEERQRLGGLRTYSILSLFGGMAGLFFYEEVPILSYIMFSGVLILIIAAYVLNIQLKQAFGLTTEIAVLTTFVIGFLTTSDLVEIEVVLVILVLLSFFLSQKRGFGNIIRSIQHKELIDIIKFGLIAIVILPLLPNENIILADVFKLIEVNTETLDVSKDVLNFTLINPFKMWFIVVLISGINLFGYLLAKFVGAKRGIPIAAFIGGLISSTSTTIALATKSKAASKSESGLFAGSAVISNAVSFVSTSLVLAVSSFVFLKEVLPAFIAMFAIGIITGTIMIILTKKTSKDSTLLVSYEPFSVVPALKFVGIIIAIKIVVQTLQLLNVEKLSLVVTAVSGLTGLDPAAIALSDLVETGSIGLSLAVVTLLATNLVNFFAKGLYGYLGGRSEFRYKLILGLSITAIGSLAVLLF